MKARTAICQRHQAFSASVSSGFVSSAYDDTRHIMVRIKHRYLLVNILYPEQEIKSWTAHTGSGKPLPHLVQFRRPSPDDLSPQLMARSIKDQIALLYGDYGVGLTSGGLNGINTKSKRLRVQSHANQ